MHSWNEQRECIFADRSHITPPSPHPRPIKHTDAQTDLQKRNMLRMQEYKNYMFRHREKCENPKVPSLNTLKQVQNMLCKTENAGILWSRWTKKINQHANRLMNL